MNIKIPKIGLRIIHNAGKFVVTDVENSLHHEDVFHRVYYNFVGGGTKEMSTRHWSVLVEAGHIKLDEQYYRNEKIDEILT